MVRTQTGSDSGGMQGGSQSTVGVALASTIGVAQLITKWAPWRVTEYTIRGKVVASPKSGPW